MGPNVLAKIQRIQYSDFHDIFIYYVETLLLNWENREHQNSIFRFS